MAERDGNGDVETRSGSGSRQYYRNQTHMETEELASKTIQTQNKRFYLDVKQNARGRFIKIAEVTPGGHKNRLTLSMPIACEFRNVLCDFIEHYSTLGPTNPDALPDERRTSLKTERITRENKRYFLDLKENQRGRFLRVRQQQAFNQYNQDGRPNNPPQIALPAQGMVEFRDALTALIDEFAQDAGEQAELPSSHVIGNYRSKMFFLDVGHNQRGVFMRVTEQTRHYRSAVTIPEKFWDEFADFFKNTSEQMEEYYQQMGKERPKEETPEKKADVGPEEPEEEQRDERRRTDDYDDREDDEPAKKE
uniref:PUR-alpha/beta/gamma protein n=1 Tax=Ciona intestinalis TaxID=7719 RepID=Q4H2W4_CIOIN|nr:PUR-alpha/beta/gamma protein [Ciona intestinalis]BAE06663.1 Ci-PUR-alpha/beta/gamma [Ciona intestinalis]|eukprot:NP_001071804.1 PUR-alpha/beta/gamma protein [Ciona intestinalis]